VAGAETQMNRAEPSRAESCRVWSSVVEHPLSDESLAHTPDRHDQPFRQARPGAVQPAFPLRQEVVRLA
jgi:hypothetical protein